MESAAVYFLVAALGLFVSICTTHSADDIATELPGDADLRRREPPPPSLCAELILPSGYPCSEHIIQTKDGYRLALQRVASHDGDLRLSWGPPILLQHGLFMAGDSWFLNTAQQSLGFILADHGFDVWVGNVRGTRYGHGHIALSQRDKEFWDWSWQELALYDLPEMIYYVYSRTGSKVHFVGHSQGTIMALAAFTQPDLVEIVEAAALLSPISYLDHLSSPLVRRMVIMHIDQMILDMGIHQLNFRSAAGIQLLDALCDDGVVDCSDLLSSITGKNSYFNSSRVEFYLQYEPHPSSSKNVHHLFQMIRKGTFAFYDYGLWRNLKQYGNFKPPEFNLSCIPKSLPLWMAYGGNDALGDATDLYHTLKELKSKPELLYLEDYGHVDFILSVKAKEDVYDDMIRFFMSFGKSYTS